MEPPAAQEHDAPTCEGGVIESISWVLYPLSRDRKWALAHRRNGGLVEGLTGAELRELSGVLTRLLAEGAR